MKKRTNARTVRKVSNEEWLALVQDWEEAMKDLAKLGDPDEILEVEYTNPLGASYPGYVYAHLGVDAMAHSDPDLLIWATSLVRGIGEAYRKAVEGEA